MQKDQQARSLRLCIAAAAMQYWVNGAATAAVATRLPEIAERIGLDYGGLSWALAAQAAGLIAAVLVAGRLVDRVGAARMGALGTVGFAAAVGVLALADSGLTLALALLAVGIANGPLDAAVPALAADLERRRGRPTMSLVEFFFVGGLASGGGGAAASVGRVAVSTFVFAASAAAVAVALLAAVLLRLGVPGLPPAPPEPEANDASRGRGRTILFVLAAIAFASLWAEGALTDWSTFLFRERGVEGGQYALGYISFTIGLAVVLFAGGRLIDRFGPVAIVRAGGVIFGAGVLLTLLAPSVLLASAGLALAGAGLGNIHPVVMSAAGGVHPRGRSIATVTALSYIGLVASKPTIGQAAEVFTLGIALSLLVVFGLLMTLLARAVEGAQGSSGE